MPLISRGASALMFILIILVSNAQGSLSDRYSELSKAYDSGNFQIIIDHDLKLIEQAVAEGNEKVEAQASGLLGMSFARMRIRSSDRAKLIEKAIANPQYVDPKYRANLHQALAIAYTVSGDYYYKHKETDFKASDSLLNIAIDIYAESGKIEDIILGYRSLAFVRTRASDYVNNFKYKMKAYELAVKHGYSKMHELVSNIALNYNASQRWDDAIQIIQSWIATLNEEELDVKYAVAFQVLATAYEGKEEVDSAIKYYKKSYELLANTDQHEVNKSCNYEFLARCYHKKQDWDSLQHWINLGDDYFESKGNTRRANYLKLYKGYVALKANDFKLAEQYADLHLEQARKDNWIGYINENNKFRYELNKKWGNTDDALHYFEALAAYRDSTEAVVKSRVFEEFNLEVKTTEQRVSILELQSSVRAKNQRLMLSSVALLFVIGLSSYVTHRYRSSKKIALLQLENKELENEKMKENLLAREQQLSDHTTSMLLKNQAIDEVDHLVSEALKMKDSVPIPYLMKIKRQIANTKTTEDNWDKFLKYFGAVHGEFFTKLNKEFGQLSRKELKHCALIKMNMSLKESADILGVNPESVKVARYRLKKRISPDQDIALQEILSKI